jgi:hypothetical protein
VQRLIVLDDRDSKSLVGVISLSDIASKGKDDERIQSAVSSCSTQYQRVA